MSRLYQELVEVWKVGDGPIPDWDSEKLRAHPTVSGRVVICLACDKSTIVNPGDYIIRRPTGELSACKAEAFEAGYNEVSPMMFWESPRDPESPQFLGVDHEKIERFKKLMSDSLTSGIQLFYSERPPVVRLEMEESRRIALTRKSRSLAEEIGIIMEEIGSGHPDWFVMRSLLDYLADFNKFLGRPGDTSKTGQSS